MEILKKPLITEKANSMNERGIYTFIVEPKANKFQIKDAVEKMYGVNVESVRTMNYAGKSKTRYTKSRVISGRTSKYKKALVQLAEGEIIDFYENV